MSLLPMSGPDQGVCYPPLCYPNCRITGPLLASFVLAGVGAYVGGVCRLWVCRESGLLSALGCPKRGHLGLSWVGLLAAFVLAGCHVLMVGSGVPC